MEFDHLEGGPRLSPADGAHRMSKNLLQQSRRTLCLSVGCRTYGSGASHSISALSLPGWPTGQMTRETVGRERALRE